MAPFGVDVPLNFDITHTHSLKQYFSIIYDFMLKGQVYFRFVKLGGYGHHIQQCAVLNL